MTAEQITLFFYGSFLVNSKHTMQLVRFPNEWLVWISFFFFIESNPLHNSEVGFMKKNNSESGFILNQTCTIVWFPKGSCMLAIFLVNSNQTTISVVWMLKELLFWRSYFSKSNLSSEIVVLLKRSLWKWIQENEKESAVMMTSLMAYLIWMNYKSICI